MFNDSDWTRIGNSLHCIVNSKEVRDYAKRFRRGHWSFFGLGDEENGMGTYCHKPEGKWENEADQMIKDFAESGHPIFRGTGALNRGILKRKGGRNTIHSSAKAGNIEFFYFAQFTRQISSVSTEQSRMECDEIAEQMLGQTSLGMGKSISKVNEQLTKHLVPRSWFFGTKPHEDRGSRGKLLTSSLTTIQDAGSSRTISVDL